MTVRVWSASVILLALCAYVVFYIPAYAENQKLTCTFERTLRQGMRGEDVRALQTLLNTEIETRVAQSGAGSPGNETLYFGPATHAATIQFQERYAKDILHPLSLVRGTGLFGASSRTHARVLCASRADAPTTQPVVPTASGPPPAATREDSSRTSPDTTVNSWWGRMVSVIPGFGASGPVTSSATPRAFSISLPALQTLDEGSVLSVAGLSLSNGSAPYTYLWNFGDSVTSSAASPAHSYDDDGSFTVTLTITDARGSSANASMSVVVENAAPVPNAQGTYAQTTGTAVNFSATSTDPGADDVASGFTYLWNFGNGATSSSATLSYTYVVPGTYTVTLTSTDTDGATGTTTTTATITGDPLILPGDGWAGATSQPSAVGDADDFGYDANTIARWDTVPYQTVDTTLKVSILAFHNSGIDRVAFAVEGGEWTEIEAMSYNDATGATEYWATIRASDFDDGSVELRAIAYPNTGVPRVLDSLYLAMNANDTLPETVKYVATTGNDTTGDGSEGNPYRTISRAITGIQTVQGADVGGGIVYLQAGAYAFGSTSEPWTRTAANRWLTISAAPGLDADDVSLTSYGATAGVRTQKVRVRNLLVNAIALPSVSTITATLWMDSITYVGPGRTVGNSQPMSGPTTWNGGIYYTDSEFSNSQNGPIWGNIVRNVYVHDIGGDAFQNSSLVVNSRVETIDASGTIFHPDVWQATSARSNVILYGITATSSIGAQGVFADSNSPLTDVAFVDLEINNQDPNPTVLLVFQFGATTTNMYVLDSDFTGTAEWRTDFNFVATNVVVENSTFSEALNVVDGVTIR